MRLESDNPMLATMRVILIFEIVIVWLAFPGMLQVSGASVTTALVCCLVATVLCIAGVAGIKRRWGFYLGWAAQLGLLALGLLTAWMYAMGAVFGGIWMTAFFLGTRIAAHRKAEK